MAVAVEGAQLEHAVDHPALAGGSEAVQPRAVHGAEPLGDDRLGQPAADGLLARPAERVLCLGVPAGD